MIDNTRRNMMKFIALLGLATVAGIEAPVRVSIKEKKRSFGATCKFQ